MAEIFTDILRSAVDANADLVMTEVYQEIANVTLVGADLGDYEYNMSTTHQFDQTITSEYFRFSIDGGVQWGEFIVEPSDNTNRTFTSYGFPALQVSGDLQLIIQARKETATGVMTVHSVNAWIKRIG